jgi:predicted nuclease of restriction endonuclease-like (RecB) superfamily
MTKLTSDNKAPTELKAKAQQISLASQQLFVDLQQLIINAKKQVNSQVNAALTLLYWQIGKQINNEILQQQRASYGQQIVKALSQKLSQEFGKGFNYSALTRMQKFYNAFSDETKVATLSQQLSWSHIVLLLPIKDSLAQEFYAQMSAAEHWSVRTLRNRIDSMLFERTALSSKPEELIQLELNKLAEQKVTPDLLLKDPYLLDFLELKDHYLEKDLEDGILRELEQFLLELGSGFSFIARQHRVQIGQEDFYIDLLFYNRKLKRLVAIDLKLGNFKAAYKGQMELYLRYLAKHEQEPDELPPLGIILCASKDQEQIELLELGESGIHVGEYLTALPSKAQLQHKLHQVMASRRDLAKDQ